VGLSRRQVVSLVIELGSSTRCATGSQGFVTRVVGTRVTRYLGTLENPPRGHRDRDRAGCWWDSVEENLWGPKVAQWVATR